MQTITAQDLMNPDILTVREDMPVRALAAFLMSNEITGAPVESRNGQLIGVVSVVDIARAASGEDRLAGDDADKAFFRQPRARSLTDADREVLAGEEGELLVRDIMTPEVYTVAEDASVSEVAATLVDNHLHRLLVTRGGKPAGILSTSDLLGLLIEDDD